MAKQQVSELIDLESHGQRITAVDSVLARLSKLDSDFARLRSIVARLEPFEKQHHDLLQQLDQEIQEHSAKAREFETYRQRATKAIEVALSQARDIVASTEQDVVQMRQTIEQLESRFQMAVADMQSHYQKWRTAQEGKVDEWREAEHDRITQWQQEETEARSRFLASLESGRREFEHEQFRKLDDVQQAYRLVSDRQREAEAGIARQIERVSSGIQDEHARVKAAGDASERRTRAGMVRLRIAIVILAILQLSTFGLLAYTTVLR